MNGWMRFLEKSLEEDCQITADIYCNYFEIDLLESRHTLEIINHARYDFIIILNVSDETGGLLRSTELYSNVKLKDLTDTIDSIYRSYQ